MDHISTHHFTSLHRIWRTKWDREYGRKNDPKDVDGH
jgi:hypothetical protein